MKFSKILLSIAMASSLISCSDFLDREPLDIISDSKVWDDANLVKANLLSLYAAAPTRRLFSYGFAWGDQWYDGTLEPSKEPGLYTTISDEAVSAYTWTDSHLRNHQVVARNDEYLKYWDYALIRNCNDFLEKVTLGGLSEEDKAVYQGEVRFIRAFVYFEMVKRYGGVPIIAKAQNLDDPHDELYPSRDTEKDCYDFIISECRDIADNYLPEQSSEVGRANKYVALSLLSRAALYAGSIAKYGTVQLDGVLGIDSAEANGYYKLSLEASDEVLAGPYQLYEGVADKADNYQSLFIDSSAANQEIIFARQFVEVDKGHSFDYFSVIQGYGSGWGSCINPTLDMVEAYDMVDGSSGVIDWENETRPMMEILANKDPRMHATVVYNGCDYGDDIKVEDYIIETKIAGSYKLLNGSPNEWKTWSVNGSDVSLRNTGNDTFSSVKADATKSGFYIKKFINFDNLRINAKQSGTDWIEFRLAEILLNKAEAAQELGEAGALQAINDLRRRAGVAEHTSIDIDKIRRERRVELAFECHRLWDMNRWRIAETEMNKVMRGVAPILRMPENTYRYITFCCDTRSDNFDQESARYFNPDRMYYSPLGEVICNNNPNIVENSNYVN